MAGKWVRKGKRKERQSGAHWSPNIPVLNMKIYYSIMCSVCKLEGSHMKRSQTKSLLCSDWPLHPFTSTHTETHTPPSSFVCFLRERAREGERERESGRNRTEAEHTLAGSDRQTHRSTGEQHAKPTHTSQGEVLNPGTVSAAVKLIATGSVTCSPLSLWGKTLSWFGEKEAEVQRTDGEEEGNF